MIDAHKQDSERLPKQEPEQKHFGVSLGSMFWAIWDGEDFVGPHERVAVAGLLSRTAGEPLRLDTWYPPHPRGSGASWPPEAAVGSESGAGRVPLAAAWTGWNASKGDSGSAAKISNWPWLLSEHANTPKCLEVITVVSRELLRRYAREGTVGLAIPNDFDQWEQQQLLDDARQVHPDVKLLWRPVAAALAWLRENELADLNRRFHDECNGRDVVVVHADWGHTHCSRLTLQTEEDRLGRRLVPVRGRPDSTDRKMPGVGWALAASARRREKVSVWQELFATNVTDWSADLLSNHERHQSCILNEITGWEVEQASAVNVARNILSFAKVKTDPPAAILVVGDFAAMVSQYLGDELKRSRERQSSGVSLAVHTGNEGEQWIASGVERHLSLVAQGMVSYFDTLPSLELFIDKAGKFEWLELLGDESSVPGGQPWRRPESITGLAIPRGTSRIKLVVAHEEYRDLRELTVKFPNAAEQRVPVTLDVSCTPAQGNAELQLVADRPTSDEQQEVLADWNKMTSILDADNNPISKEDYLKSQPRAFPELMPRKASVAKWRVAKSVLEKLVDRVGKGDADNVIMDRYFLDMVKQRLMEKDAKQQPHDATAIGSDFTCPVTSDQKLLEAAEAALLQLWRTYRNQPKTCVNVVVRALGYMSSADSDFESWLINRQFHPRYSDSLAVEHTSGLALRDSEHIRLFVERIFVKRALGSLPGANELKGISQILRYRSDATERIATETAELMVSKCLQIFQSGLRQGGKGFPFRWSSLIIVYILRRRMYDSGFLDPEGDLAMDAKKVFLDAIRLIRERKVRPMGGTVDVPGALQQMINYIDRRGSGDILMAAEE